MPDLEAVHQELGERVAFLGLALQDRVKALAAARRAHRGDLPDRAGPGRVHLPAPRGPAPARPPCCSMPTARSSPPTPDSSTPRGSATSSPRSWGSGRDRGAPGVRVRRRDGRHREPVRVRHAPRVPQLLRRHRRRRARPSHGGAAVTQRGAVGVARVPGRVRRGRAGHLPPVRGGRSVDALGDAGHRRGPGGAGPRHAAGIRARAQPAEAAEGRRASGRAARCSCSGCRTRSRRSRAPSRRSRARSPARSDGPTSCRALPCSWPIRSA